MQNRPCAPSISMSRPAHIRRGRSVFTGAAGAGDNNFLSLGSPTNGLRLPWDGQMSR